MKNENLKTNKTKLIAKLMLVVMLLSLVATTGCSLIPQKTTEENKHHEPEDLVNGMLAKMQAAGYEKMEGIAYAYLKAPYLDRQYNLEVEIVNESIFLNGVIYDEITYDNNYELKYDDAMFLLPIEQTKSEILESIKAYKSYYILKSSISNTYGYQVAVYESGNTYYFFTFDQSYAVIRVHELIIE